MATNFWSIKVPCPACSQTFKSWNFTYVKIKQRRDKRCSQVAAEEDYNLAELDQKKQPVLYHRAICLAHKGKDWASLTLTTYNKDLDDVMVATAMFGENVVCNEWDEDTLHAVEAVGTLFHSLLITNDKRRHQSTSSPQDHSSI